MLLLLRELRNILIDIKRILFLNSSKLDKLEAGQKLIYKDLNHLAERVELVLDIEKLQDRKLELIYEQTTQILEILLEEEEIDHVEIDLLDKETGEIQENISVMKITDVQQIILTAKPKNKKGQPAPVEPGSAMWAFPSFVAPTPSADGMQVTVVAMGVGEALQGGSFSCDADLGEGVVTLSTTFDVIVVPSQAVSVDIEEGEISDQVTAGPDPNA